MDNTLPWTINRAHLSDAARVVEYFRTAFAPEVLPYTIRGSLCIWRCVEDHTGEQFHDGSEFYVLVCRGAARGALGLWPVENGIVITGVHVDAEIRRHACSNRFLSVAVWCTGPLPADPPRPPGGGRCIDSAAAGRQYKRWGFSELEFPDGAGRQVTVGNLAHCYPLPDPRLAEDYGLLAALAPFGAKQLLLVTHGEMPQPWTRIANSVRFPAEADVFLRRMESHINPADSASVAA